MTRVRWFWELMAFALLSVFALYAMAPFRNNVVIGLILLLPLALVFLLPPAVRAAFQNTATLLKSFTWWHWLVFFALISALNLHTEVRDVKDVTANPLDSQALFRIMLEAVVAFILLARLVNNQTPWLRHLFRGLFSVLTVFAIISLSSTFWSVKPLWTLYKSFEYAFDLVLVVSVFLSVSSMEEYERLLDWMWTLTGFLMASAWASAILDPANGFGYGAEGLFPIPQLSGVWPALPANAVGTYGALISIVALARLLLNPEERASRGWYKLVFGFGMVTMVMADCRSAIFGFVFGVILLLILSRRLLTGFLVGLGGLVVALFTGFGDVVLDYLLRGQQQDQVATLTGRTEWWSIAWKMIQVHPLRGWGAYAGGRFIVLPLANQPGLSDVDSSIFEPLLDTGVFGLFFLLLALAGTWWYLLRGVRNPLFNFGQRRFTAECIAVLGVITVRCFFVSNLIRHPAILFMGIIGVAEIIRRRLKSGSQAGMIDSST
jgi:O-antigen ligase